MSENENREVGDNEKGSLLAFLYRLRFDQGFNQAFKRNDLLVMKTFGLNDELINSIRDLGERVHEAERNTREAWAPVGEALTQELFETSKDPGRIFW